MSKPEQTTRKHRIPEEKIKILRQQLLDNVLTSEVCSLHTRFTCMDGIGGSDTRRRTPPDKS